MPSVCLTIILTGDILNTIKSINNVKHIIDMIFVVDVGITNEIIDIITKWSKDNNIPCKVHSIKMKFETFDSHDELEQAALDLSRNEFGYFDYFLYLRFPYIIKFDDNVRKDNLTANRYNVRYNLGSSTMVTVLYKTSLQWKIKCGYWYYTKIAEGCNVTRNDNRNIIGHLVWED